MEFEWNGKMEQAFVKAGSGEVILSAGSVGSPHILLLSGIGPKEHLVEHGVLAVSSICFTASTVWILLRSKSFTIPHKWARIYKIISWYRSTIRYVSILIGPKKSQVLDNSRKKYCAKRNYALRTFCELPSFVLRGAFTGQPVSGA